MKYTIVLFLVFLSFVSCSSVKDEEWTSFEVKERLQFTANSEAGVQEFTSQHMSLGLLGTITVDGKEYSAYWDNDSNCPEYEKPNRLMTHTSYIKHDTTEHVIPIVDTIYGDWFTISLDINTIKWNDPWTVEAERKIEYKTNNTPQKRTLQIRTTLAYDVYLVDFVQEGKK